MERAIETEKLFHEWAPLYVHLSLIRAAKAKISFPLRYQGQEVANLDQHLEEMDPADKGLEVGIESVQHHV